MLISRVAVKNGILIKLISIKQVAIALRSPKYSYQMFVTYWIWLNKKELSTAVGYGENLNYIHHISYIWILLVLYSKNNSQKKHTYLTQLWVVGKTFKFTLKTIVYRDIYASTYLSKL